jgi:hypothetical protein
MMNLKIAIPVKEVKADMMHTLEPHPKNYQVSEYRQRESWSVHRSRSIC